jgi:hypothetical protein
MEESESPTARERGSGVMAATIVALALPLLYALSIGPTVWLIDRGIIGASGKTVAKAVYAPLIWAHDHTFLEKPIERYIGLWITERVY